MTRERGPGEQWRTGGWAPPAGPPRHRPRRALWLLAAVPLAVVALPLVAGLLLGLGGLASEDFEWSSEDGPDSAASSLAEGRRAGEDLTADVLRALAAEGRVARGVACPATPVGAAQTSVACAGTVEGWERVSVNLHEAGRFTVVGSATGPEATR